LLYFEQAPAQTADSVVVADSLSAADTLAPAPDSVLTDSLQLGKKDAKKPFLEAEVSYASEDSLIFKIGEKKVFLYDKANVDYQDISLKADRIEYDFNWKTVSAAGAIDSSGKLAGKPEFTQGSDKFTFDTINYNFDSRKGKIKNIITQQGEGFVHSTYTKRFADGEIHMRKGMYTTCDAEHPHFYISLTKAISIPKNKTVSGPAFLVFEDMPLPFLGLPFGFFPNTSTRASGLILPDFRDEQRRGFGLVNGGWYMALGEYVDLTLLGSIFSRGTWMASTKSSYYKRYKFSGSFNADFAMNRISDDPNAQESKDFKVQWSHSQDSKANPTRKFSANVNFSTASYEQKQSTTYDNLMSNQKNSSISYSKNWPGRPFNFAANLNGTQSTKTRQVNLLLPSMTFNMNRIYPFRGKNSDGKYNWLENIQVSYSSQMQNKISTTDSLLFTNGTWKKMQNGFSHSIPISLAGIKLFKLINITPQVSYNGVLFPYYIRKTPGADTSIFQTNTFNIDTIRKITYAHAVSTSLSISASPKIYGTFVSKQTDSYIEVVRHVMTPSISAYYTPDMSSLMPNYYRRVAGPATISRPVSSSEYSIYDGQLYSPPSLNKQSASVRFGLNNNLEMKVRSKNDTTGKGKKIVLIDNLNFSTGYNPLYKTFKWSTVSMTGSTSLFKNRLNLTFNSYFDPYALDSLNKRVNKFQINEKGRLFRTTSASITAIFRLQSGAAGKKKTSGETKPEEALPEGMVPDYDETFDDASGAYKSEYVDFDIPWSFSVDYSWSYSKPTNKASYTHTIMLSGDISITPKWKIGGNTNYDIVAKEFSFTNISIHRELHCWEMRISVVPFGDHRSYSFTINAKSSILRDLKYDKRESWYDNL
jgi:lipopolysaccharide assembly outer membrane protein LptD (OstA)